MTATRIPKARIVRPAKRPFQVVYDCPVEDRRVRISTGTRDESKARKKLADVQAQLQLGIAAKPKQRTATGPQMPWAEFRELYAEIQLSTLRTKTHADAESRLDIAERILRPRTLSDVADRETLHRLQTQLLEGVASRDNRPRSPFTAASYMKSIIAALNWAEGMGWLPSVPKIRYVKTSKRRHMKGRPITASEFKAMLAAVEAIVGKAAAPSWRYVLRGLWESGLRIGELMVVHWSDSRFIVPEWSDDEPVLTIPADMQKNDTEEAIPLLPGFEDLLLLTPEDNREGWIFNPLSLQLKVGRPLSPRRPEPEWVGKVITKIGERAGIVVTKSSRGKPPKYASAHDLRRSCADRLIDAGVVERDVAAVMRHASVETTRRHYAPSNVQRTAAKIRTVLCDQV